MHLVSLKNTTILVKLVFLQQILEKNSFEIKIKSALNIQIQRWA